MSLYLLTTSSHRSLLLSIVYQFLYIVILYYTPLQFLSYSFFFFFNDTAPPEIYPLSLHDALPIWSPTKGGRCSSVMRRTSSTPSRARASTARCAARSWRRYGASAARPTGPPCRSAAATDRKSTRLNSSHSQISYAVFCLKKITDLNCRCRDCWRCGGACSCPQSCVDNRGVVSTRARRAR